MSPRKHEVADELLCSLLVNDKKPEDLSVKKTVCSNG